MKRLVLLLAPLLLLCAPDAAVAKGLSKAEKKKLANELMAAAKSQSWTEAGGIMGQLAAANDKKVWQLMVKVAERSPGLYDLHTVLRRAAEQMDSRAVQKEIKRTARRSKSHRVRQAMVLHLAKQKDWDTILDCIDDKHEDVAALAVWKLVDGKVVDAIEPMIVKMEKLEKGQKGIYDVLRNGLGKLLGDRRDMAFEYRTLWKIVQDKGGLETVRPTTGGNKPNRDRLKSGVRLFGRDIDCSRVVFILDVSGSMEAIDPNQKNYDDDDKTSRSRGKDPGESGERRKPKGKTRLERAKRALKKVIDNLPSHYKINIVAYSSRVKIWRGEDGDNPATVHILNDKNKKAAIKFVEEFVADGVTATDTALRRAYSVESARCFYLLSDGFATHDGQNPVPTEEILGVIEEHKERHVAVHTLGFREADRQMMKALAKDSGGKYSDIE